jgi:hypothetical protein
MLMFRVYSPWGEYACAASLRAGRATSPRVFPWGYLVFFDFFAALRGATSNSGAVHLTRPGWQVGPAQISTL